MESVFKSVDERSARMRSDSVKNMSAYADQNHEPSLAAARLEYKNHTQALCRFFVIKTKGRFPIIDNILQTYRHNIPLNNLFKKQHGFL